MTTTPMSGGTVDPEIDQAIEAMGDEQYDFIGCPYSDAVVLDAFKTEMNDTSGRWSPFRQIYGHVYTAKRGTLEEQRPAYDDRRRRAFDADCG